MNKWLKAGVILVVLILLFIPTIVAMKYVAIAQIYSYFVDSVSSLTGLNTYLVKAVIALMLVSALAEVFSLGAVIPFLGCLLDACSLIDRA